MTSILAGFLNPYSSALSSGNSDLFWDITMVYAARFAVAGPVSDVSDSGHLNTGPGVLASHPAPRTRATHKYCNTAHTSVGGLLKADPTGASDAY